MSTQIEVPGANQQNIPIFAKEPNEDLIAEIKQHIRETSSPHTWRGHSHTKPPDEAFVVYVEEFDVPAPNGVRRVAPCPCCSPVHAKYKCKGKIAWFPNESVIRLIGPQCFAAINADGHDEALVDLRKRQKRSKELGIIALHAPTIETTMVAIENALPIANDLDSFMREVNRVIDNELDLNLWREVKESRLAISESTRVQFQRADGSSGERTDETKKQFATISGYAMIDRSGQMSKKKLVHIKSGLATVERLLRDVESTNDLADTDRERIAGVLSKGRRELVEILFSMEGRQSFLTTDAIMTLGQWGQHPKAPIQFSIQRKKHEVVLSASKQSWSSPAAHRIPVGINAEKRIPELPEI